MGILAAISSTVMKITATQYQIPAFAGRRFWPFSVEKRTAGKIQFGFDTDIGQRTETNEQLQDLISYTLYSVSSNVRYNIALNLGLVQTFLRIEKLSKLSSQVYLS